MSQGGQHPARLGAITNYPPKKGGCPFTPGQKQGGMLGTKELSQHPWRAGFHWGDICPGLEVHSAPRMKSRRVEQV